MPEATTQASPKASPLTPARSRTWIVTEGMAVVITLLCVWLCGVGNILNWPLGILGAALYTVIFYRARLYSDVLLQIYFLITSVIGWITWSGAEAGDFRTILLPWWVDAMLMLGMLLASLGLGWAMRRWTRAALPYRDATIAVLSVVAQYLLTLCAVEAWVLWVAVDVLALYVYHARRLYLTMALYAVLLAMAVQGLLQWIEAL